MKQVFPLRIHLKLKRKPWRSELMKEILAEQRVLKDKFLREHELLHKRVKTVSTTKWIRRRRTSCTVHLHPVLSVRNVKLAPTRAQA